MRSPPVGGWGSRTTSLSRMDSFMKPVLLWRRLGYKMRWPVATSSGRVLQKDWMKVLFIKIVISPLFSRSKTRLEAERDGSFVQAPFQDLALAIH